VRAGDRREAEMDEQRRARRSRRYLGGREGRAGISGRGLNQPAGCAQLAAPWNSLRAKSSRMMCRCG
jgi:hypothetical protein